MYIIRVKDLAPPFPKVDKGGSGINIVKKYILFRYVWDIWYYIKR
jgi:hypothetical protein